MKDYLLVQEKKILNKFKRKISSTKNLGKIPRLVLAPEPVPKPKKTKTKQNKKNNNNNNNN